MNLAKPLIALAALGVLTVYLMPAAAGAALTAAGVCLYKAGQSLQGLPIAEDDDCTVSGDD